MTERRPPRTLGPGHDLFWAGCAEHELRLPRDRATGALVWPVTAACADPEAFDWETLSGRGMIVSRCRFHQDYYRGAIPVPYDVILVALEEGPLFIANPHGFGDRPIALGTPVAVTFVAAEDGGGTFQLPVFAPRNGTTPAT